jgi:hypothetical protein
VGAVPQALDGVAQCVDDVTFAIFEPRCCSPECGLVRSVERQFVNQVSAVRMHWDAVISAEMIRRRQDLCVRVLETPVGTQRLNLSSLDRWPSGPNSLTMPELCHATRHRVKNKKRTRCLMARDHVGASTPDTARLAGICTFRRVRPDE